MKKRDQKREDKQQHDSSASVRNRNHSNSMENEEEAKLLNDEQSEIISKDEILTDNK